jgi:hypothetical protein
MSMQPFSLREGSMGALACQRKRNASSKAWKIQLIIENGFSIYFHRMYITEISDTDIVAS